MDAVYAATALTPPQLRDSEDRVRAEELSSRSIAESQLLQFDAGYEQHKLDGRWHSEARSVTRLGEVSMQLRLVDAHNNEPLPPATTWSEAEVAVALWRFGRDADIAMDYAASMRDRFGSLMKDGGRFVIPVPMEREGEGWSAVETPGQSTIYYDQRFGLLVNESMEQ